MIPLKLELSGFTCFREPQELSFDGLELFAISGPTGSGKSTLLDAMTYALYGQTARLGHQNLDVLISPGLSQMRVSLAFRLPAGTYRVTRTQDRKPSGRVEKQTRIEHLGEDARWLQLPESEKLREADAKLGQLLSLDYEGFTRAVLLPQGAFDEFLRGDAAKRRQLLVNLLGLERLGRMREEAGRRAREAEHQIKSINLRLEQDYALVSEVRQTEAQREVKQLEDRQKQLSKRQQELELNLKELDTIKQLIEEQLRLDAELKMLRQNTVKVEDKRQRLQQARLAASLMPLIAQRESLREKLEAASQRLQELREAKEKQAETLRLASQHLQELKEKRSRRLPELRAEISSLQQVVPQLSQLKSRGGNLGLAALYKPNVHYSDEAWEKLELQARELPLLEEKNAQLEKLSAHLKQLQAELSAIRQQAAEQDKSLKAITEKGQEARQELEQARRAADEAQLRDQAAALRQQLAVGDMCPVCQQVIELLTEPQDQDAQFASLKLAQEAAQEQVDALLKQHAELKADYQRSLERMGEKESRIRDYTEQREAAQAKLRELTANITLASGSVTELKAELRKQRECLLAALAFEIEQITTGKEPEQVIASLKREESQLEHNYKDAEEGLASAERALRDLATEQELRSTNLESDKVELDTLNESLTKALKASSFSDAGEVQQAALTSDAMQLLEVEIGSHTSQLEQAQKRELELQVKLDGRQHDELSYQAQKEELQQLSEELTELYKTQGRLMSELERLAEQLHKRSALMQALDLHKRSYETYDILAKDLRGNEFQDYLINQVQAQLAQHASRIIREVTDGRYDLHLSDGDYQVKDYWNAGSTRLAKTLSGGETFIASLALALALSDTLAGSTALGALFLDEGFGTLDATTLDAVALVLENLTKQGRMVGVITHVKSLTDRLPARISVIKQQEGSRLSYDLDGEL